MFKTIAICTVLLLAIACQAGAVTSMIDSFNGSYDTASIGVKPVGWTQFGYGPPAQMVQETGLVLAPNDGSNSAWRINCPGNAYFVNPNGNIWIYKTGIDLDNFALPGQPIDWNFPVYLKVDVHGADYSIGGGWTTIVDLQSYERSGGSLEWGDNGQQNGSWATVTKTINAGQAAKSGGVLILGVNMALNGSFAETNAAIFENLRMDYTAVPEPSSLAALAMGVVGLGGLIRRRK